MTTCLGKSCSFGLPRVPFVNCCQFMYLVVFLLVLRAGCGIWLYQFLIIAYLFTLYTEHNSRSRLSAAIKSFQASSLYLLVLYSETVRCFSRFFFIIIFFLTFIFFSVNFWVGGTDLLKENHWIWVRSQTWMTTSVFSDWQRNEPNNRDGSEHCIALRASASGQWNDAECHTSVRFICERELK